MGKPFPYKYAPAPTSCSSSVSVEYTCTRKGRGQGILFWVHMYRAPEFSSELGLIYESKVF